MKILCIGEALIDMICTDTGSTLVQGRHFLKKPGGAPTNVAAAVAALGGEALLAAKVGNDPFGDYLVEVMNGFNVDTRYVLKDEERFTTFAFVSLKADGERDFVFNRGADGQLSADDVKDIALDDCAVVHFGSATAFLPGPLQEAYCQVLQAARRANVFISFDPNYRPLLFAGKPERFIEQSRTFLQQCHFFKVSLEEALLLTGRHSLHDAVADLRQRTAATFCVTLGKDGALLVHAGEREVVPAPSVNAIDSTGAGDAFVGALLYQVRAASPDEIRTKPFNEWRAMVANANKAGARTCAYTGAMEAFRHLSGSIFN